jgi:hypothetical protein
MAPDDLYLTSGDIAFIRKVFEPFNLYVWHIHQGGAASPAIKKIKRAFGNWPSLHDSVVVKSESVFNGECFFCDIASVSVDSDESVADLAKTSMWGKNSGLFLSCEPILSFPKDLLLLGQMRLDRASVENNIKKQAALKDYVRSSKDSGIVPLLVAENADARKFLVAHGFQEKNLNSEQMGTAQIIDAHSLFCKGMDLCLMV